MSPKVINEFVIPKCTGKAFRVNKGQVFRVIEDEGKQVAGLIFLNAHNYKEQFMAEYSGGLSFFSGKGSHYRLGNLYSKVPYENVMLTVTDNKVGDHFLGPHCTRTMMEILMAPGHRSYSDNFADSLREFGLELEDIYSVRIAVEGYGAFLAAQRITDIELERLEVLVRQMREVFEGGDRWRLLEINREFYAFLYAIADRPRLYDLIMKHLGLADMYRRMAFAIDHYYRHAIADQEQLLNTLRRHEPEAAEHLTREQLQQTLVSLLTFLEQAP